MKARWFTTFVLVVILTLLVPGGAPPSAAQSQPAVPVPVPDRARVSAALRSAPLMFIENVGQFDQRARFQVRGGDATLWLAEGGLWVTVGAGSGHRLKLSFVGADPAPRLEPFNRLDTHVSYFVGSDRANWRADVPVWGGVRYVDLYPGVDLEVTGDGGRWAWQLVCRADCQSALQRVRLRVEGADALSLDGDVLRLSTALGEYALPLLQVVGAEGANLASPTITGDQVAWPFASAIPNIQSAIADLQSGASDLLYSTFLGGSSGDGGHAIAVDGAGSAYVVGETQSSDFPTTAGAFDTSYNGPPTDIFVVKVNADGTGLAYATFLGGKYWEFVGSIAVDQAGSAYVTGATWSGDFPTTVGAFDTNATGDAFVVKVNAEGTGLVYATGVGGTYEDFGHAIAIDGAGSAYVTGYTESADFPTTAGAFDRYCGTDGNCNHEARRREDAFVVKVNADGTGLVYGTFLGGSDDDRGYAIAVDGAGSAYVGGDTYSSDFPITPGAFDPSFGSGYSRSFVVKVNADGTGLAYATFLRGGVHKAPVIAVDGTGNAYVTGSAGPDFPTTAGAFDTSYNGGGSDAFVVKLNAAGTGLVYATFLGGSNDDRGYAIAVDGAGSAYVAGPTDSLDFPTTVGAFDTSHDGGSDAYVVKLNADGAGLAYATFLGGGSGDGGGGIAVDGVGSAYVTGYTDSSDFPTTAGAFDTSYNGDGDAFVAKISTSEVPPTPTATATWTLIPSPTATPSGTPPVTPAPTSPVSPTPTQPPGQCFELISNGGFETYEGWTILDTIYDATYTDSVAYSGARSMRLGIEEAAGNLFSFSSVEQGVTIPGDASAARLSFWYQALRPSSGQALPGDTGRDYGYVLAQEAGGGWRILSIIGQATADWARLELDLMPFAGQTIVLRFGVRNDGQGAAMAIYMDDVSLQVCRGGAPLPTPIPTATPPPPSTPTPTGTAPPPPPTPTQPPGCPELIRNGGFETGEGWEMPNTPRPAAYTTAQVHSGSRAARLGIEDPSRNVYSFSSVQQVVTIPLEATGARLSFWYLAQKGESTDYGYIVLQDANQVWRTLSIIRQPPSGWQRVEVDVSHYAGQAVLLRLGVRNDGQGGAMAVYLDDVSLQACQR
jgi:hypothetical protein